jgi:4-amino-4-deoxy-L-arabinose transferase-like glycosyltransferase
MKTFPKGWWLDVALIGALIAFAAHRFWCPPEIAVNKLQESPKYMVGAWYLYKTGLYECFINHQSYPAMGSVGYALLLVPSFWLFGDFLGNAIYSQLALAVLTCLGVYATLRICFGRWQGFVAGIVLASYPEFTAYARMNDTSIALAFLLMVGLLLFLKTTADARWPSLGRWFLWGLCAGWAGSVRLDSFITFGLLTLVLLWAARSRAVVLLKQLGAMAAGAIGPLAYVGWLNQHYCGSWLRDLRCYWDSVPSDSGWRQFDFYAALGFPFTHDPGDHGNLRFYGREILGQFVGWGQWSDAQKRMLILPSLCLAGLMIAGVGYAWRQRLNSEAKRRFWTFTTIATAATLLFYLFLRWAIVRYIVSLAPLVASFVGIGVAGLAQSLCRRLRTRILGAVAALGLAMILRSWLIPLPVHVGDMLPVILILQSTASRIESNAIVISTAGPLLTDFFVIRGTRRQFVPPDHRAIWRVQPGPPKNRSIIPPTKRTYNSYPGDLGNGAVDIFEFSAIENPDRIDQLLRQGVPVYFLDHTFGNACNELPILAQDFALESVVWFQPAGPLGDLHPGPFLWRLHRP